MASGKKNYFRHSFNARNDEFIMSLMNEFGEKGYFMWFALCEMCGEMLSDGHKWPLKFNKSRLYKELRCNQHKLNLFLTYTQDKCKISSTYVEPIFTLEIPSLSKYLGKYSEISPNKKKEKEIKEKENKYINKPSPLSFLFHARPEIQKWLDAGNHDTHSVILAKNKSHHELAELLEKAFTWSQGKDLRAETWLLTFIDNKKTTAYGSNQAQKQFKPKGHGVIGTPENPTGDPYLQEAIEKGLVG